MPGSDALLQVFDFSEGGAPFGRQSGL